MTNEQLLAMAAKWEGEIAVAYDEYSHGQRAGLEQAAAELKRLLTAQANRACICTESPADPSCHHCNGTGQLPAQETAPVVSRYTNPLGESAGYPHSPTLGTDSIPQSAHETLSVAEPEAWLFHVWKPGEHRVYASIDENDNTWWPRDQWKGVTRVPLVIQGELTLLHGVLPPGELGRHSQKAGEPR